MRILFSVACDLARSPAGEIICGPETTESNVRASEIAHRLGSRENYTIIASAGVPPDLPDIVMSELMKKDLICMGVSAGRITALKATTFNTEGEVRALVHYLRIYKGVPIEISICCKWWHLPRVWVWLRLYLYKALMEHVTIRNEWCHTYAPARDIVKEFCRAWPYNAIRMIRFAWGGKV